MSIEYLARLELGTRQIPQACAKLFLNKRNNQLVDQSDEIFICEFLCEFAKFL